MFNTGDSSSLQPGCQVPPGPGPLCSRDGARTWAGRQSEPQLGGGKTSGDEAQQLEFNSFPSKVPRNPTLLITSSSLEHGCTHTYGD